MAQPSPTANAAPPSVTLSTRGDARRVATLDELCRRWNTDRSGALGRMLDSAESEKVRQAVEHATHEHRPGAERYRVIRGGTVGIKTGVGTVPVPTEFRVGQVIDRGHFPAGYVEQLVRQGILLDPLP